MSAGINSDIEFMRAALELAAEAEEAGEVPVGAVVVKRRCDYRARLQLPDLGSGPNRSCGGDGDCGMRHKIWVITVWRIARFT